MIWNTFLPIVLSYFCVMGTSLIILLMPSAEQLKQGHTAQPLDVSFFAPLKRYWSSTCHEYMNENTGMVVTKLKFSRLFSKAWVKAIKPETIIIGFRKTGTCPFNKSAIKIAENIVKNISEIESPATHRYQHLHLPQSHHYRLILLNQLLAHLRAKIS